MTDVPADEHNVEEATPIETQLTCPMCGKAIEFDWIFCPACREPLSECGEPLPTLAEFRQYRRGLAFTWSLLGSAVALVGHQLPTADFETGMSPVVAAAIKWIGIGIAAIGFTLCLVPWFQTIVCVGIAGWIVVGAISIVGLFQLSGPLVVPLFLSVLAVAVGVGTLKGARRLTAAGIDINRPRD